MGRCLKADGGELRAAQVLWHRRAADLGTPRARRDGFERGAHVEPWMRRGECRNLPVSFFYIETTTGINRAKKVCANCSVLDECRSFAIRTREGYGVWGGLTASERELVNWSAEPGGPPPATVVYTTNARSTGASCSAGRREDNSWGVVCNSHGQTASVSSRTLADRAVSRPQEWCPVCREIAAGHLGRVEGLR